MNTIDARPPFFPNSKTNESSVSKAKQMQSLMRRNSHERIQELKDKTGNDANVSIPDKIKDFSRIKRAVDVAPEVDNSQKIADLKARIQSGTYQVDYDALADKMLKSEF